jgi:hypothetical protein
MTHTEPFYVESLFTEPFSPRHHTPEMVKARVQIYLRYTVPSILRQTVEARPWLNCYPGTEEEMKPFMSVLEAAGVMVTFDRGMAEANRIAKDGDVHAFVHRMDSDDVLSPMALEVLLCARGENPACQFQEGYAWFIETNAWHRFFSNCPRMSCIRKWVISAHGFLPIWIESHCIFMEMFRPVVVPGRHYIVTRHPYQVSGPWTHTDVLTDGERHKVEQLFRIHDSFWTEKILLDFLA